MDVILTTQISLLLTVYTDFKTINESQKFTGSNKFSHIHFKRCFSAREVRPPTQGMVL